MESTNQHSLIIPGYFKTWTIQVTPELLRQIWDAPQTVGGGASTFETHGGTVWRTSQGWGFSRTGSQPWGWVNFHDPNPGRGETRWTSPPFQTEEQAQRQHPGAKKAVLV